MAAMFNPRTPQQTAQLSPLTRGLAKALRNPVSRGRGERPNHEGSREQGINSRVAAATARHRPIIPPTTTGGPGDETTSDPNKRGLAAAASKSMTNGGVPGFYGPDPNETPGGNRGDRPPGETTPPGERGPNDRGSFASNPAQHDRIVARHTEAIRSDARFAGLGDREIAELAGARANVSIARQYGNEADIQNAEAEYDAAVAHYTGSEVPGDNGIPKPPGPTDYTQNQDGYYTPDVMDNMVSTHMERLRNDESGRFADLTDEQLTVLAQATAMISRGRQTGNKQMVNEYTDLYARTVEGYFGVTEEGDEEGDERGNSGDRNGNDNDIDPQVVGDGVGNVGNISVRQRDAPAGGTGALTTVDSEVNRILAEDGPMMQFAGNQGMARAARRGFLGSNLAAGSAQAEVYRAAIPMAQDNARWQNTRVIQGDALRSSERNTDVQASASMANARLGAQTDLTLQERANIWQSGENILDREFRTSERESGQEFTTSEREGGQRWNSGERGLDREWGTSEREAGQDWRTGEREASQGWQDLVREDTQEFQNTQTGRTVMAGISSSVANQIANLPPDLTASQYDREVRRINRWGADQFMIFSEMYGIDVPNWP